MKSVPKTFFTLMLFGFRSVWSEYVYDSFDDLPLSVSGIARTESAILVLFANRKVTANVTFFESNSTGNVTYTNTVSDGRLVLENLTAFTAYTVEVYPSSGEAQFNFTTITDVGTPSQPENPRLYLNENGYTVEWDQPSTPKGPVDGYLVKVRARDNSTQEVIAEVHHRNYTVIMHLNHVYTIDVAAFNYKLANEIVGVRNETLTSIAGESFSLILPKIAGLPEPSVAALVIFILLTVMLFGVISVYVGLKVYKKRNAM